METIWLQRPSGDIPWGFRLQGGRDFNEPLSVQRVTPGSVAANGLVPGDVILKIGHVTATGITHSEAQEVICGASNILQLTIQKGAAANTNIQPASSVAHYSSAPKQYSSEYDEQQDRYQTLPNYPDYRIGSGYHDYSNANSPYGYDSSDDYTHVEDAGTNSPYDMRHFEQTAPISGYSTMPARSGNRQNSEYVRPMKENPNQNKYPFKATAGIKLNINLQNKGVSRDDMQRPYNEEQYSHQSQPISPVQYVNGNKLNSSCQRQTSAGSNKLDQNSGYTQSYFKTPVPFSPGCNTEESNNASPPRLQRQTSSSSQNNTGNVYESTISKGFQSGTFIPRSDDAPPSSPSPPTNCQSQPEQYQRQTYDQDIGASTYQRQPSQQGSLAPNMFEQRQNDYNSYQQTQTSGIFVDTTGQPCRSYQQQGSNPYEYNNSSSTYQQQPSMPTYYEDRQLPTQSPVELQRQISFGRQQPIQTYSEPISPPQYNRQTSRDQQQTQKQPFDSQCDQQYVRQQSREQRPELPQYTNPSPPSDGMLKSFEDVLSPFEKFQNTNYCDKQLARDNLDSGAVSSVCQPQGPSSDNPRSNMSSYSSPQTNYDGGYNNEDVQRQSSQTQLRAAPPAPPPPPISPQPPPPPLPPSNWTPSPLKTKVPLQSPNQSGGQPMPDKVLNTMLKHGGSQKPFAYLPTGADLKEFKEKAKQRRQPRPVMPRGYIGPAVGDEAPLELQTPQMAKPKPTSSVSNQETSVYMHDPYNSPLRGVDVTGNNSTPERRPSDIKDSEVYKMIQETDIKEPSQIGNYDEASIRYRGNHIPSPSFRLLQSLAKEDEMRKLSGSPSGRTMTDSEDDGLPDKLNEEEIRDKRYTGKSSANRASSGPRMKILGKPQSPKVAHRPTSNRSSPLPHGAHQEAPSSEF